MAASVSVIIVPVAAAMAVVIGCMVRDNAAIELNGNVDDSSRYKVSDNPDPKRHGSRAPSKYSTPYSLRFRRVRQAFIGPRPPQPPDCRGAEEARVRPLPQ